MSELVTNGYAQLFALRLFHHYWLDEGGTDFDLIPSQVKKDDRLLAYDAGRFLTVAPTASTLSALQGLRCVFRPTASGAVVAAPKSTVLPLDSVFEFVVTVQDPAFFNYTSLTLRPQKIYEIYYQPEDRIYRYKENVAILTNLTGATRGAGPGKRLFLSTEIPALGANDPVESLFTAGAALRQLTGDQPGAASREIAPQATDLPAFVHQGDAPVIVPPAGMVGAPARGLMLSDEIPDRVFALIRLSAVNGTDADFSLVDAGGQVKPLGPAFEVHFKNRSTTWQYFSRSTGALIATEPEPLPLTFFGNAGTKQKPSEGLVKAVQSGGKVTQLISEIYV